MNIAAAGRSDFVGLEVVFNGEIVHVTKPENVDGVYRVCDTFHFSPNEPGWLAIRTPWETQKNLFGETIRAHSSAVYFTKNGQSRFNIHTARGLISEMALGMHRIESLGQFASDEDRRTVMNVYRDAIEELEARIIASQGASEIGTQTPQ